MQDYDFVIRHRLGIKHQNADHLYRCPRESCEDPTDARLDQEDSYSASPVTPSQPLAAYACPNAQSAMHGYATSAIESVMTAAVAPPQMVSIPSMLDLYGNNHPHHGIQLDAPWEKELVINDREALTKVFAHVVHSRLQAIKATPATQQPARPPTDACINTRVVAPVFFQHARDEGIVLVELFGGLCAGLQICLRNGVKVNRYVFCDSYAVVRNVAMYKCEQLRAEHATLIGPQAVSCMSTTLPQDVWAIGKEHIKGIIGDGNTQVLVVAGW